AYAARASSCCSGLARSTTRVDWRRAVWTRARSSPPVGRTDEVVDTGVERSDLVALLTPRGQHDNLHRRPVAQPPDHFEAVDAGQIEMHDDDVGPSLASSGRSHPARAVAVAPEQHQPEPEDHRGALEYRAHCSRRNVELERADCPDQSEADGVQVPP